MAFDASTFAVAKSYTDKAIAGGGSSIKGKNCTISDISPITGGNRVTFQWTMDDGTVETDYMDVMNGQDGAKGDKGDKGETGAQGIQGVQGEKGEKGDKGDTGATGAQGEQGEQGIQGVQGEKGDKGDKGDTGAQGEQGIQGIQGIQGEKGDKGDKGDTGAQGIQGEKGDKGDKGDVGQTGTDGSPIGTVISFMGNTAPFGYLTCDGTVYNIADYQGLADFFNTQFGSKNYFGGDGTTTFAVPDLRGEFLRGTGTNSHGWNGSGSAVGAHQDGTIMPNVYASDAGTTLLMRKESASKGIAVSNPDGVVKSTVYAKVSSTNDTNASNSAAKYTSRPTNTSVMYCIKYMENYHNYSTTEQAIGTWVDGNILYQKTFNVTTPSAVDTNTNITDLTNLGIAVVVNTDGVVVKSATDNLPINFHNKGTSDYFCTWCQDGYLKMATGSSGLLSKTAYITLQYTKVSS